MRRSSGENADVPGAGGAAPQPAQARAARRGPRRGRAGDRPVPGGRLARARRVHADGCRSGRAGRPACSTALPDAERIELGPELFARLADRDEPPELLLVGDPDAASLDAVPRTTDGVVVLVDRPSSPGNLGTIIRTADALGAGGMLTSGHGAHLYDPRTIRASVGSLFTLPVVAVPSHEALVDWVDGWRATAPDLTRLRHRRGRRHRARRRRPPDPARTAAARHASAPACPAACATSPTPPSRSRWRAPPAASTSPSPTASSSTPCCHYRDAPCLTTPPVTELIRVEHDEADRARHDQPTRGGQLPHARHARPPRRRVRRAVGHARGAGRRPHRRRREALLHRRRARWRPEAGAAAPGRRARAALGDVARLVRRGWQRLVTSILDCEKPVDRRGQRHRRRRRRQPRAGVRPRGDGRHGAAHRGVRDPRDHPRRRWLLPAAAHRRPAAGQGDHVPRRRRLGGRLRALRHRQPGRAGRRARRRPSTSSPVAWRPGRPRRSP